MAKKAQPADQSSLFEPATTKEKIEALAKQKASRGKHEPVGGLFGDSHKQMDLVDMAKQPQTDKQRAIAEHRRGMDRIEKKWAAAERKGAKAAATKHPLPMTVEGFAKAKGGLTTTADVQGHIHAGLRSAPTSKSYKRRYDAELNRLQNARDATNQAYRDAIKAGEIREFTHMEKVEAQAKGLPDRPATQAAQRVLAKRAARMAADPGPVTIREAKPHPSGSPIPPKPSYPKISGGGKLAIAMFAASAVASVFGNKKAEASQSALVKRPTQVTREGKTFTRNQWVKPQ